MVMVSIICLSYNHERYLANAFESMLKQIVNFDYEIIVHDDASTDNSQNIIKEYFESYPDIFIPILQTENQYSKNIDIFEEHIYPRVRGKYIAFCEGDDYWIDEYKLQKQFDFMEKNLDCSLCVHSGIRINAKNNKIIENIVISEYNNRFSFKEAINGLGSRVPSNSFFYRVVCVSQIKKLSKNLPKTGVGDFILVVLLSLFGDIYYMKDKMSVYRYGVDNSWTNRMNKSVTLYAQYLTSNIDLLNKLNNVVSSKYNYLICERIIAEEIRLYVITGDYDILKRKGLFNRLSAKDKFKLFINYLFLKFKISNKNKDKFYYLIRRLRSKI